MPPTYKVVVAGNGNVGKTSLIRRWCEGKFETSRVMTIGVDFQTKLVPLPDGVPGGLVKLSIWDMAGQERFQSARAGFYRGSRAVALVYDVTEPASLAELKRWVIEIHKAAGWMRYVVVGNKADLQREAPLADAQQLAFELKAPHLETSAATGAGVPALFEALARLAAQSA
ncbi:MAG: Rab family GTPase [Anaerolineales bacterium]